MRTVGSMFESLSQNQKKSVIKLMENLKTRQLLEAHLTPIKVSDVQVGDKICFDKSVRGVIPSTVISKEYVDKWSRAGDYYHFKFESPYTKVGFGRDADLEADRTVYLISEALEEDEEVDIDSDEIDDDVDLEEPEEDEDYDYIVSDGVRYDFYGPVSTGTDADGVIYRIDEYKSEDGKSLFVTTKGIMSDTKSEAEKIMNDLMFEDGVSDEEDEEEIDADEDEIDDEVVEEGVENSLAKVLLSKFKDLSAEDKKRLSK